MKNNCNYHQHDGNNFFFESEMETHLMNAQSKRIHKPITSSDMWFIQKNYKRRSIGDQINYRF